MPMMGLNFPTFCTIIGMAKDQTLQGIALSMGNRDILSGSDEKYLYNLPDLVLGYKVKHN